MLKQVSYLALADHWIIFGQIEDENAEDERWDPDSNMDVDDVFSGSSCLVSFMNWLA